LLRNKRVAIENPFAVLIKNKEVAESLNSIHDMVWDRFNP